MEMALVHSDSYFHFCVVLSHRWRRDGKPTRRSGNSRHTCTRKIVFYTGRSTIINFHMAQQSRHFVHKIAAVIFSLKKAARSSFNTEKRQQKPNYLILNCTWIRLKDFRMKRMGWQIQSYLPLVYVLWHESIPTTHRILHLISHICQGFEGKERPSIPILHTKSCNNLILNCTWMIIKGLKAKED